MLAFTSPQIQCTAFSFLGEYGESTNRILVVELTPFDEILR